MDDFSIDELKHKMTIINPEWHPTVAEGDQAHGRTLEDLLGVPENNISLPDYGNIEIKTKKLADDDDVDNGYISLFTKEPKPREPIKFQNKKAAIPLLLLSMGYKHWQAGTRHNIDEKSFNSTLYGHKYNVRGMKIEVDESNIKLIFNPNEVDKSSVEKSKGDQEYKNLGEWLSDIENRKSPNYNQIMPLYYEKSVIENLFLQKLNNIFFVLCRKKKIKGKVHFKYVSGFMLKDLMKEKIKDLFTNGIVIEITARTHHNHGTRLRITRDNLFSFYNKSELIF